MIEQPTLLAAQWATFPEALRGVRRGLGLTQTALAERLDCDHTYISRLARGDRHPSRGFCERIVRELKLDDVAAAALLAAAGYTSHGVQLGGDPDLVRAMVMLNDPRVPSNFRQALRDTLRAICAVGAQLTREAA